MGVATRFGAAWRALRGEASSGAIGASAGGMNDVDGATFFSILGPSGLTGSVSERDTLSVPAALRALEVLCGLFAMTPCVYYRRLPDGGKERVDDAPQARMLRTSANDVQSAYLLKEVMLGDMLMRGSFGGFIHRDNLYRAEKLTRLDPQGIAPMQSWSRQDGLEVFYDANLPDGSRERLSRNDIWYVPGFSRDGIGGVDRLKLLCDTIEGNLAMSRFAARFWLNNAQPTTVLKVKAKVEPTAKAQIKTDWVGRFSGPRNAGAVAVLDQDMDAQFHAHDNKAAQYIEGRSFGVVEIARAFGVPPHVLFELSRATFSNIEQQSLELVLYSMMGHFERVAAAATHQFAEEGHFFEFLVDALTKGDLKSRYEAYAIAVDKGILNPNEVRTRENLNRRDGGDDYRLGSGSTVEGAEPPKPAPPVDHRPPAPEPEKDDE